MMDDKQQKPATRETLKLEDLEKEAPQQLTEAEAEGVQGGIGSQSTGAGAGKVTFNPF